MVVTHEVGTYEIVLMSHFTTGGGGHQVGFVYFYEPNTEKYIGYAGIIQNGQALPPNQQGSNGVLNIYFHESSLVPMLDTLRNEKPVYVKYNTDLKWGSVGAAAEPVGEQQPPATP